LSAGLSARRVQARVGGLRRDGLYYHLLIDLPELSSAEPGQFVMIGPEGSADPILMRPMSVLAHEPGRMEILFSRVGRGTGQLAEAATGEALRLLGPLGRGFTLAPGPAPILVGGGAGVPPLCFLSRRLAREGIAHRLLLGFNRAADIPDGVLEGLDAEIFTMDGSRGVEGHPVAALEGEREPGRIQACGPPAMLEALAAVRREGEPMEISLEEHMACGMGFCRGCVTPVKEAGALRNAAVCREGPVFDADRLAGFPASAREGARG